MVVTQPYSERPARMAYALTEDGTELAGVLRLLAAWGASGRTSSQPGESDATEGLRHVTCGSLLEARWYCPTCSVSVGDDEGSTLRYA